MIEFLKRELDTVYDIIDELKSRFNNNDIRLGVFDGHFLSIKQYLTYYKLLNSVEFKNSCKYIYNMQDINIQQLHDERVTYYNPLNSNLLINSWSNFELFITLITEYILSDNDKNELLSTYSADVLKILKGIELTNEQIIKIKKLDKAYLAQCPITLKYGKIFKLVVGKYHRNINVDREFLDFYGRLRNCIHSNFIFYGKDCSYNFQGIQFEFKNNEVLSQYAQNEKLMPNLSIELRKIILELINSLEYPKLIQDKSFK